MNDRPSEDARVLSQEQGRVSAAGHNRPTIELRIGETERIVDEIEVALIRSDRDLYRRGGLIVSTGFDKMQTWDGRTIEVQIIEERGNYALLEDIDAAAVFTKFDALAMKWHRAPPNLPMALTLKQRTNRLRLPNLVSVVNCPTIKANGELMAEPGFYDDVGILFDPRGVKFPQVHPRPNRAMAEIALAQINRLVRTFDFVSPDDKAVALSLILTAVARPGLPTAPLHGFDAPVAGAGKSKLVDIASILATGHEAGVVAQGETREEAEIRFSTLLMRGDLIIAIDNCEGPLEGVVFNQALTQSYANLRILGQSKAIRVRCAALITATGNNLVIKGDLTRRSVVCRLDPKVERPELRQFTYDPIADAKDNRGELVAAALTILRAYHVAGRPPRPPRLQSFEQWSDTVRGAFGDQPTTVREAIEEATDGSGLCGDLACGKADECIRPHACQRTPNADLRDALMTVSGRSGKIDGRTLGNWLAQKAADRVVNIEGGPVAMETCGTRQGFALWHLTVRR